MYITNKKDPSIKSILYFVFSLYSMLIQNLLTIYYDNFYTDCILIHRKKELLYEKEADN